MLLDIRERNREAEVNRLAQAAAGPALPAPPHHLLGGIFDEAFGLFRPVAPEQPRLEPARREPYLPVPQFNHGGDFEWIDDPGTYIRSIHGDVHDPHLDLFIPGVAILTHQFTRQMITTLTCGYCNSRLNSVNDLKYHLSNVRYHAVFSCCGRFFKRAVDLDRHRVAKYVHNNEVIRNA